MDGTKKKIGGPSHLDDALAASLARLGQAVQERNSAKPSGEKAGQADQVKALKDRQRADARADAQTTDNQARGGLVNIRHPNRDFFLV